MNKSGTDFSVFKNVDNEWGIVEIIDVFAPLKWGGGVILISLIALNSDDSNLLRRHLNLILVIF